MNFDMLYEYALGDGMINIIDRSNDALSKNHPAIRESMNPIFRLASNEYFSHNAIVEVNNYRVETIIASLFVKMLDLANIEYRPENIVINNHGKVFIAFSTYKNKRKTGYIFCFESSQNHYFDNHLKQISNDYDSLVFVLLIDPVDEISQSLLGHNRTIYKDICKCNCTEITLRELFIQFFSNDEYNHFLDYVSEFNEKAQYTIGKNTTLLPTEKSIQHFKKIAEDELIKFDYKEKLESYKDLYSDIYERYINQKRYLAMLGDLDFAKSFIGSEWNFKIHELTEAFDQTGIAAGYLKSVEQLLYELICFSKGDKHRKIAKVHGGFVSFCNENEKYIDSTLRKLENYLEFNTDLFHSGDRTKDAINAALDDWRTKYRNGYFHKDNLYKKETIEEIRAHAMYLYFLMLGSWKLNASQKNHLCIWENKNSETFYENQLSSDVYKYIKGKIIWAPNEAKAIYLSCFTDYHGEFCISSSYTLEYSPNDYIWQKSKIATVPGDYSRAPLIVNDFTWEKNYDIILKSINDVCFELRQKQWNCNMVIFLEYSDQRIII